MVKYMSQKDVIRCFVYAWQVRPARRTKRRKKSGDIVAVNFTAREVYEMMAERTLPKTIPVAGREKLLESKNYTNIVEALDDEEFSSIYRVCLISRAGAKQGPSSKWTFQVLP